MGGILEGARTTKSTLPGHLPTWSILTVILALAVGIAVGMYHWASAVVFHELRAQLTIRIGQISGQRSESVSGN
jgi:hypothetical protein